MGEFALQRYRLGAVLGRGATGVVYEAYDAKDGAVVALKTIEASDAESLYRLKQEFRALADVQHRNLVRFGELSYDEGHWFFTMELVRGTNFVEYVRPCDPGEPASEPPPQPPRDWTSASGPRQRVSGLVARSAPIEPAVRIGAKLDEARLRNTLPQLVDALAAIHDAGHVHRDVKPANVLVSSEGRVVLLDFGLVTALRPSGAAADPGIVGTPGFMAPEQAEGKTVGPPADWYALGVLLFLALTGRLPFEGGAGEVLAAKLTRAAPPVRDFGPDAPADLAVLCADLLRSDPAERPTAAVLRARLGASPQNAVSMLPEDPIGPFVGRESEHAALRRAFADVRAGERRIVLLEGEPGVGKSALVQRFVAGVGAPAVVLAGRCYEQETVPLKGIDGIVDSLSEYLLGRRDLELAPLIAGGVRYLAAVFPVLKRVPAISDALAGGGAVGNETALRSLAFGELERLIEALARHAPLILILDDLQWADADSVSLLTRLLLAPSRGPSLFIATLRSGAEVAPEIAALAAHGLRIPIRGLDEGDSRALLDALLPADAASPETRAWAMREAAGHPFFLAELARSARAGELNLDARAPLVDVLWERVQSRDPIEQRFLEMTALAGAPTPYTILANAADVDVSECLMRLAGLRAAQLVRITRRGDERLVEPYHDRIREAITGHIATRGEGSRTIAERHLRLGRALRDAQADDPLGARIFASVQHLDAARDLLEPRERNGLAKMHLAASRMARHATAYDRARAHATGGLALLGEGAWTNEYEVARDLSIARMEAEYLAGDSEGAGRTFETTRQQLAGPEDRAAVTIAWIGLETGHGRCAEAIVAGREALRALGAPIPTRVSMLHVLLEYGATRRAQGGRSVSDLVGLEALRDPARASAMRILVSLAPAAFFLDTNLVTWILLRIAGVSIEHGVCDASSYGFVGYGSVLAGAFDAHAEGYAFGRAALALNERFKNDALAAKLHNVLGGYIAHWTRPFRESIALLREAYDHATKYGDTSYETYSATVLSVLTFSEAKGLASQQSVAEWAREVGERRGDRDMASEADTHVRHAAALRGLTADPRDLGVEGSSDADFRASLSDRITPTSLFHYSFCRAELAYLFGDADGARAFLRDAAKRKQVAFSVPPSVELCFLEALVAARRCDSASWVARPWLLLTVAMRVRRLAVWARSCPENYDPYYRLARAELARVSGRTSTAAARFEEAIASARTYAAPKREAMAIELLARHVRASGDPGRADRLRGEAADAYRRWGAEAKAEVLALSGGSHDRGLLGR